MRNRPRAQYGHVLVVALGLALTFAMPIVVIAAADQVVIGTEGNDELSGTPAAEALYGRGGDDEIDGGGGADELDGGAGADLLRGGLGSDAVSYAGGPVSVTLDGTPDDGTNGERDNVGTDVEDIFGTSENDKLIGSSAANTIDGDGGDDRINGNGGTDALFGGDGEDIIDARDKHFDWVDCGDGEDTAILDREDDVAACEKREVPRGNERTPKFALSVVEKKDRVVAMRLGIQNRSRVVLACRSGCEPRRANGKVILLRRGVKLGRDNTARINLPEQPKLVGGTVFEVGVTAPGAGGRCIVHRIASGIRSVKPVGRRCQTGARSR